MMLLFGVVLLNVAIPICIAVFVYRDAKKRGMEPILWAAIAVVIPSFIGLIIYLLARSGRSTLYCAHCGSPVDANYVVCPQCGTALKAYCSACGRPIEPDWKLCANCGAPIEMQQERLVVEQPVDNRLLWIVLAVAAVLVVLFLGMLLVYNVAPVTNGNTLVMQHHMHRHM